MDNYARALEYARELFLQRDQEALIRRCRLCHDADYLYLNFLGDPWKIERSSGQILSAAGAPASFSQGLSIYDYICRAQVQPELSGRFCPVNSLPHVAQSNPDTGSLHQRQADFFQLHIPALRCALDRIALSPFPKGDAACLFPVFDGFNAVFQFWEADEDFPPSICFLWDEHAQGYLKYETLYYVMDCFLQKLHTRMAEIEKNV